MTTASKMARGKAKLEQQVAAATSASASARGQDKKPSLREAAGWMGLEIAARLSSGEVARGLLMRLAPDAEVGDLVARLQGADGAITTVMERELVLLRGPRELATRATAANGATKRTTTQAKRAPTVIELSDGMSVEQALGITAAAREAAYAPRCAYCGSPLDPDALDTYPGNEHDGLYCSGQCYAKDHRDDDDRAAQEEEEEEGVDGLTYVDTSAPFGDPDVDGWVLTFTPSAEAGERLSAETDADIARAAHELGSIRTTCADCGAPLGQFLVNNRQDYCDQCQALRDHDAQVKAAETPAVRAKSKAKSAPTAPTAPTALPIRSFSKSDQLARGSGKGKKVKGA